MTQKILIVFGMFLFLVFFPVGLLAQEEIGEEWPYLIPPNLEPDATSPVECEPVPMMIPLPGGQEAEVGPLEPATLRIGKEIVRAKGDGLNLATLVGYADYRLELGNKIVELYLRYDVAGRCVEILELKLEWKINLPEPFLVP